MKTVNNVLSRLMIVYSHRYWTERDQHPGSLAATGLYTTMWNCTEDRCYTNRKGWLPLYYSQIGTLAWSVIVSTSQVMMQL